MELSKEAYLKRKMNEAVFIACARGWYRGIVREVGKDGVLLSNPYMIFEESSYTTEKPREEYPIPSDLFICLDAVEMVCQPTWCFYGYEKLVKK